MPLDVHLMIDGPGRLSSRRSCDAGASRITVHVEVLPHLHRTLQFIRSCGVLAGVAINPSTPVGALEEIAGDVDQVLVMSVNPGFGGQTFIPRSESKIRAVRALLDAAGNPAPVDVDGGVDHDQCRRGSWRPARHAGRRQRDLPAARRAGDARSLRSCVQGLRAEPRLRGAWALPVSRHRVPHVPSSTSAVRVRYAETDKMGVVYYANYFVWFEVARADLLRSLGWSYREMETCGGVAAGDRGALRVPHGARYDDELDVRTEGRMLSPVRMEFTYEVVRRAEPR